MAAPLDTLDNLRDTSYDWLGRVEYVHRVGAYEIVELTPWKVETHSILHGHPDEGKREFHANHRGWDSLDKALIGVICEKYDGPNERLSVYVSKALGIPPQEA